MPNLEEKNTLSPTLQSTELSKSLRKVRTRPTNKELSDIKKDLAEFYQAGIPKLEIMELLNLNETRYNKYFLELELDACMTGVWCSQYSVIEVTKLPKEIRKLLNIGDSSLVKFKVNDQGEVILWSGKELNNE